MQPEPEVLEAPGHSGPVQPDPEVLEAAGHSGPVQPEPEVLEATGQPGPEQPSLGLGTTTVVRTEVKSELGAEGVGWGTLPVWVSSTGQTVVYMGMTSVVTWPTGQLVT